jgi:hypothetical protein
MILKEFKRISRNVKVFKGILKNFKELEVACHLVNSSFKEFKGI